MLEIKNFGVHFLGNYAVALEEIQFENHHAIYILYT